MVESPLEINDIKILTPHTFTPAAETTSTEDSGRVQTLDMNNNPIGTIESYNIGFLYIPVKEAALIYNQTRNKSEYKLRYMSLSMGEWTTGYFYTTKYSFGSLCIANGKECYKSMSFNAIAIHPV